MGLGPDIRPRKIPVCFGAIRTGEAIHIQQSVQLQTNSTPAVKFLDLIFRNNFLSSILAKCARDESCRGEFPPTSPKGLVLVGQTDFCVHR